MKRFISIVVIYSLFTGCGEEYYFKKAFESEAMGNFTEAISYLDIVISKNPNNYYAYINRGADKSELDDFEGAIEDYTKAINIAPEELIGYMNRAGNKKRLNDYAGALKDYDIVYNKIEGSNDLVSLSGKIKLPDIFVQNDYYIDDYSLFDVLSERGIAYFYLDSLSQAFNDFNYCIENGKFLSLCYYWRGFCFFKIGNTSAACSDLLKSSQLGNLDATNDYKTYCSCK